MLADAGIPLGNQMVLLNGVNNDKYVVRKMNQKLLRYALNRIISSILKQLKARAISG